MRSGIVLALVVMAVAAATTPGGVSAEPRIPSINPNSVVPAEFRDNKSWSQEGGWHWVTISYDGTQRFTGPNYDYSLGKPLAKATYVATLVRPLSASDSCGDCINVSPNEEGPPLVMGGPNNPALKSAYEHLDNGPRRVIDSVTPGVKRWTRGAWYLNYSPVTRTFFSWTWIPNDGGFAGAKTTAEVSTPALPSLAGIGQVNVANIAAGSRVFPVAGAYQITQGFGCVPPNSGYASPSFCPPDRPSFHDGVDIAAVAGTPILAAAGGTVTFAGIDRSASGNSMIVIDLDGSNAGYQIIYMHWETTFVKVGDHVSAGQVIAAVGSIGYSTGPHLHFSVRAASTNQPIDPLAWLTGSVQLATSSSGSATAYANVMRWQSLIRQAANAHHVPAGLIAAIMAVESSGNPSAVSPAGALGLMQMMPDELKRLGVPEAQWLDPASNIDAAARYLAETLGSGGTIQDATARYFGSGCDVLGTCTNDYINRVLTLYVYFATWIETDTAPALPNPVPTVPSHTATVSSSAASPPVAADTSSAATATPPPATAPQPSATPTTTPVPSATPTPSPTLAATPSPTSTVTPSPTPATTPSPTPTATPETSPTPTATATPESTTTPESTPTATPQATQPADSGTTAAPTATPLDSSQSSDAGSNSGQLPTQIPSSGSGGAPPPENGPPLPTDGTSTSALRPDGSGADGLTVMPAPNPADIGTEAAPGPTPVPTATATTTP